MLGKQFFFFFPYLFLDRCNVFIPLLYLLVFLIDLLYFLIEHTFIHNNSFSCHLIFPSSFLWLPLNNLQIFTMCLILTNSLIFCIQIILHFFWLDLDVEIIILNRNRFLNSIEDYFVFWNFKEGIDFLRVPSALKIFLWLSFEKIATQSFALFALIISVGRISHRWRNPCSKWNWPNLCNWSNCRHWWNWCNWRNRLHWWNFPKWRILRYWLNYRNWRNFKHRRSLSIHSKI